MLGMQFSLLKPLDLPSKHAGSDSEAFWLQPDITIAASVQPESTGLYMPGLTSCI